MNTGILQPPRVGVGAFIRNKAGHLLLVLRRRAPEAGHWGLPGGKLDPGERLEDAVRREIGEELGVTLFLDKLLCIVEQMGVADDPTGHWIAPTWVARLANGGEPKIQEPEALADCGWFPLQALPSPLTLATQQAIAAFIQQSKAIGS